MRKTCPFCGKDKLKVDSKSGHRFTSGKKVNTLTGSVRCNCCHGRGPTVTVSYMGQCIGILEQLEEKAFEAWNMRSGD